MSDKIVIDDAMRARARDVFSLPHFTDERLTAALRALLDPPAEPEVVVTEAMRLAGYEVWIGPQRVSVLELCGDIYIAMERARLKEAAEGPNLEPGSVRWEETPIFGGGSCGGQSRGHRRHDDKPGYVTHRRSETRAPSGMPMTSQQRTCRGHYRAADLPFGQRYITPWLHRRKDDP